MSPHLADFIRAGEFQGIKDVMHKKFIKFAYYKVTFQIGKEKYSALLNIGVRADGTSALYDINPFNKQYKKRRPPCAGAPLRYAHLGRVKSVAYHYYYIPN